MTKHKALSVLVVFGTRPEAIKLAPVIARLQRNARIRCRVCVTGQHRDLVSPLLAFFEVAPDYDLNVMRRGQTPTSVVAAILHRLDPVLRREQFDVVVVHGDTTTTMAATLAAFHRGIPVAHVEAGLRTGDLANPFPEEANRRVTDALTTWFFAPTTRARNNLISEGVAEGSIVVTGNTVIDTLMTVAARARRSPSLRRSLDETMPWLEPIRRSGKKLVLVTAHRRESFGVGIERICAALARLARRVDVEVVYAVHPNPSVRGPVERFLRGRGNVRLVPPLDYLPFVHLMMHADVILTDSGGIQEEAPTLGKPVLVLRSATERPEAVEVGVAQLVGSATRTIVEQTERLLDERRGRRAGRAARNPFGDGRASARIERALLRWA